MGARPLICWNDPVLGSAPGAWVPRGRVVLPGQVHEVGAGSGPCWASFVRSDRNPEHGRRLRALRRVAWTPASRSALLLTLGSVP